MSLLKQGLSQVSAAAKAGMSERTARKYVRSGGTPSEAKAPHKWRFRADPFAEVWPEIEALLKQDAGLEAKTVCEGLNRRHAGQFSAGQLHTLQRRFLVWRLKAGPDCEVFFPQTHVPGEQGKSDSTDMRELEVVIAGEPFVHLLYHFVLTYSNWESVCKQPFGVSAARRKRKTLSHTPRFHPLDQQLQPRPVHLTRARPRPGDRPLASLCTALAS